MKNLAKRVLYVLGVLGLDPRRTLRTMRALPVYLRNRRTFKRQMAQTQSPFRMGAPFPCLEDRFAQSGAASGHYFHQDLLVARRVHDTAPREHMDIGSRIDGFVAHVASFRPITVLDIRPLDVALPNVTFRQADMSKPIDDALKGRCDSVSCLHALEHFGLGRYGDTVCADGYLPALDNLYDLLEPGGRLYLSVPIGPQRVEFDAHRVFSVKYILELTHPRFRLERFSYVDDKGTLHEAAETTEQALADNFGCHYGCGIFELVRVA